MGYAGMSFSRKTSLCCYCHKPGARTVSHKNAHGHEIKAHRRCIPKPKSR